LEILAPRWVTAGDPATTITLTGFNFVDRSEVLIDGVSVAFERISDTELAVTVDANRLLTPGRLDIVVVNPEPLASSDLGNGTSNTAHFLIDYQY
jgi:hypothetical protein